MKACTYVEDYASCYLDPRNLHCLLVASYFPIRIDNLIRSLSNKSIPKYASRETLFKKGLGDNDEGNRPYVKTFRESNSGLTLIEDKLDSK